MPEVAPVASESREIRVFLSSTFRDFNEERGLLATQVFPELNRRAKERGVELVEVDLRWGVTQEQAEDGHALEICLQEIQRCQRYFIGMLGDSYGSLTPTERKLLEAAPSLLEQRQWLTGKIGQSSYTELEIEQRLQEMAGGPSDGRAFFYFRAPAWSNPRADEGELGWRSDDPADRQKLELLKDRIRSSGYPLVEDLESPQAIADRIKADLWALIDEQFPEGEQPDALEKEARKHADYRRSRTGAEQYIGGERHIEQLERWLEEGQQKILITGESGAGKSALISNWIEAHQQKYPQDVVYPHHLGCTNDANALRPLLGRLIDTASRQLVEAGVITEALAVPEEWWELVAKVAETLQSLGHWCEQSGRHWIWVLDGLDRLDADDQNALPWLPQNIPAGVHVVTSALACQARSIISERGYTTLTIEPLAAAKQEQLIERYLQRYTKELDDGLRQRILEHALAGSPLFLKVLLEELRQCGRHDTLNSQLEFYLSSQTIDDLYERVLERLENDGRSDAVKTVMTALWASRAGLSETELLAITGLAPLEWAPIDLALDKAFGRNGNRLVFDHDYLRIAVEDRYLTNINQKQSAHEELAHWFAQASRIDLRTAEELPWQLEQADLKEALIELLTDPKQLSEILSSRPSREIADIWRKNANQEECIDHLLGLKIGTDFGNSKEIADINRRGLIGIADLLDEMGLHRSTWLTLRKTISQRPQDSPEERVESLMSLSDAYHKTGMWTEALDSYAETLTIANELLGAEHKHTLTILNNLGNLHSDLGNETESAHFYEKAFEKRIETLGEGHPDTVRTMNNLALSYSNSGDTERAEYMHLRSISIKRNILGSNHRSTINGIYNLAILYDSIGKKKEAEAHYLMALDGYCSLLGENHRDTLMAKHAYGVFLNEQGSQTALEEYIAPSAIQLTGILGVNHPDSLYVSCALADIKREEGDYGGAEVCYRKLLDATAGIPREEMRHNRMRYSLAECLSKLGRHKEAIEQRRRELTWCREKNGDNDLGTLESMSKLAWDLQQTEEYDEAVELLASVLERSQTSAEADKGDEMSARYRLAGCLSQMGRHKEAVDHRRIELDWCREKNGDNDPGTLESMSKLAWELQQTEEHDEAIELHMKVIEASQSLKEVDKEDIMWSRYHLAKCLSQKGRHEEAIEQRRIELAWCREQEGIDNPGTITSINGLAANLREIGELSEAEALFREVLDVRNQIMKPNGFEIGQALGGLAGTLEDAGRLEESLNYRKQSLEHRKNQEGCDTWLTNYERLCLASVLQKMGRTTEACALLTELQESMSRNEDLDEDDRQLITEAKELTRLLG